MITIKRLPLFILFCLLLFSLVLNVVSGFNLYQANRHIKNLEIIQRNIDATYQERIRFLNEKILILENEKSVKQEVSKVSRVAIVPSRAGESRTFEATAYTWTGNRTATGTIPTANRTVAVDPKVIPLGSKLIINGKSGYIAEDTGGVVKGNIIDIYVSSYSEAIQFGRRKVEVEIAK